jgi:tetratricopeptide (TPR) repeat protein
MIVRDAEDCLAATLDCVRNLADEIVVVDTGSRDSSLRIAKQRATTVVSVGWTDDFSAARNTALEHVTGDWVLWLDAGETLTSATAESIRRFVDSEVDADHLYYLLIRTPAQGANIAGEQIARIRLHPYRADLRFQGRVRETLEVSAERLGMRASALSLVVHRGSREHNPELRRQRAERNLRLAELEVKHSGVSPRLLNCLGEAWQAVGDAAASARFHRQALECSAPASNDMLEAYYGLLTSLESEPNARDAQLQLCMKALEVFPLDAQLLCAIGGYLQSKQMLDLAARAYQLAAEHGQTRLEIWHLDGLQEIAVSCYAATLLLLNRENDAVELLTQRLDQQPDASRLRRQLLELHVKHQRREEALSLIGGMPPSVVNREALRNAVRGACLVLGGNVLAGKTYLESAYKSGCREPLCLKYLTEVYLAEANVVGATGAVEQWLRVDPLSLEARSAHESLQRLPQSGRNVRVDQQGANWIPAPLSSTVASDSQATSRR